MEIKTRSKTRFRWRIQRMNTKIRKRTKRCIRENTRSTRGTKRGCSCETKSGVVRKIKMKTECGRRRNPGDNQVDDEREE